MATRPKDDLAERLRAAELAVDNTLGNAQIQAAVTPFGYPAARMQEGKALLDTARRLRQEQTSRDGAKEEATR